MAGRSPVAIMLAVSIVVIGAGTTASADTLVSASDPTGDVWYSQPDGLDEHGGHHWVYSTDGYEHPGAAQVDLTGVDAHVTQEAVFVTAMLPNDDGRAIVSYLLNTHPQGESAGPVYRARDAFEELRLTDDPRDNQVGTQVDCPGLSFARSAGQRSVSIPRSCMGGADSFSIAVASEAFFPGEDPEGESVGDGLPAYVAGGQTPTRNQDRLAYLPAITVPSPWTFHDSFTVSVGAVQLRLSDPGRNNIAIDLDGQLRTFNERILAVELVDGWPQGAKYVEIAAGADSATRLYGSDGRGFVLTPTRSSWSLSLTAFDETGTGTSLGSVTARGFGEHADGARPSELGPLQLERSGAALQVAADYSGQAPATPVTFTIVDEPHPSRQWEGDWPLGAVDSGGGVTGWVLRPEHNYRVDVDLPAEAMPEGQACQVLTEGLTRVWQDEPSCETVDFSYDDGWSSELVQIPPYSKDLTFSFGWQDPEFGRMQVSRRALLIGRDWEFGPIQPRAVTFDGNRTTTERQTSDDRHGAAVALSQARFLDRGADHVVIARDDVFADALAATALLGDGPLLLVDSQSMPDIVATELLRVLPTSGTVYIVGGPNAVSSRVQDTIRSMQRAWTIKRLAGSDRYRTSVAIATEVAELFGPGPQVLVARGEQAASDPSGVSGWVDAIAAGGYAANRRLPLVLSPTGTSNESVTNAIPALLAPEGELVVLGGPSAISEQAAAGYVPDGSTVRRVAGADRFATAVEISKQLWQQPAAGDRAHVILNGHDPVSWRYGLAGAGVSSDAAAPMLLVAASTPVPPVTLRAVTTQSGGPEVDLFLLGSTARISPDVQAALDGVDGR